MNENKEKKKKSGISEKTQAIIWTIVFVILTVTLPISALLKAREGNYKYAIFLFVVAFLCLLMGLLSAKEYRKILDEEKKVRENERNKV